MILVRDTEKMHVSHIFNLVSAYHLNHENVARLIDQINEAVVTAKKNTQSVIVEQDCLEHILVVHPSGAISLYARMGTFTMENI